MRRAIKVATGAIYDVTGTFLLPSLVAVGALAVGAGLAMLAGPRLP